MPSIKDFTFSNSYGTEASGFNSLNEQNVGSTSPTTEVVEGPETDDPEAEAFIKKYGDIRVSYIDPPPSNPWFTKPYALNYFYKGRLFRTKYERTSAKLELFLDLVYVGIVANLAAAAIEHHNWNSFGKYILVFIPAFTVWNDIKEIMNYYFNDDLLQRIYVIWQIVLLVFYNNNCEFIDSDDPDLAHECLMVCVCCYVIARLSSATLLLFYSLYIKEHRFQMRSFGISLVLTSSLWYVIFAFNSMKGKIIFASFLLFIEQATFCISVHPITKKLLNLDYSTALNIEHEAERYHAFYIMAIGEFLFGLCSESPLSHGFNPKMSKGIALVIISFIFLGLYSHKDGSLKAVHAMRRSATTAMSFMYGHFLLIATLLIVGEAGADLAKIEKSYLNEEDFGVLLYFHTGILVALLALLVIAFSDKDIDNPKDQVLNRYWRTGTRIPFGLFIFASSWLYERVPLNRIIWIDCLLMVVMYAFEFVVMNPFNFGKKEHGREINVQE